MLSIVILIGAFTLLYNYLKWSYSFWKRNNVVGPEPSFIVGNIGKALNFSEHFGVIAAEWYKKYSNELYVGYFKLMRPAVMVCDPDLVKDVLITNFNSFRANDLAVSKKRDPLLATNPFFTNDNEWKDGRKEIMPIFSPSKLKNMMPVMNGVAADFMEYIKCHPEKTEFNAKDLCQRFTIQNLIKCAFSIDPECFNPEESEFMLNLKEMFEPSFLVGWKFLLWPITPKWAADLVPIPFTSASVDRFVRKLVSNNKESRLKGLQSADFLQTLLQQQSKSGFDDTWLAGHAFSLFTEGTETSNISLFYVLYEMAQNPDSQEKLLEEVTRVLAKHDGKMTYDCLQDMPYLEGVVLETLRLHPVALVFYKTCTENYTLPKTSRQLESITIKPGTPIIIPVLAIHMDPKNYPDPDKFQPERFNEEEQRSRHKGTYFGFGEGPRICPGMRFGIVQVKIAVAYLVQHFRIKPSPNQKPIVIDPQTFMSHPKDGIFVQFEIR